MRRTTLKDIAARAGVSITVVSNVVNDKPDGAGNVRVSPELREHIKALALEMNYRPHRAARTLSTGESKTIGVLTMHNDSPLAYIEVSEVFKRIREHEYDYILQQVEYEDDNSLRRILDWFSDAQVEGIIFMGIDLPQLYREEVGRLCQAGLPMVDISMIPNGNFPDVVADYYGAAYEMAKHVIAHGYKNIYVVTTDECHMGPSVDLRVKGIEQACSEGGINDVHIFRYASESYLSFHGIKVGYEATVELLASHRPDAIFYSNDFFAVGGLQAINRAGFKVPDDIAICGFDGIELAELVDPPITTAVKPTVTLAKTAVDLLFDMLSKKMEIRRENYLIPCEVLLRESSGY